MEISAAEIKVLAFQGNSPIIDKNFKSLNTRDTISVVTILRISI
jgi:hypothetical protein